MVCARRICAGSGQSRSRVWWRRSCSCGLGLRSGPIGPKARHLNRELDYAEGRFNQLEYWTKIGYLKSAPAQTPRQPRTWGDRVARWYAFGATAAFAFWLIAHPGGTTATA